MEKSLGIVQAKWYPRILKHFLFACFSMKLCPQDTFPIILVQYEIFSLLVLIFVTITAVSQHQAECSSSALRFSIKQIDPLSLNSILLLCPGARQDEARLMHELSHKSPLSSLWYIQYSAMKLHNLGFHGICFSQYYCLWSTHMNGILISASLMSAPF